MRERRAAREIEREEFCTINKERPSHRMAPRTTFGVGVGGVAVDGGGGRRRRVCV